MVNVTEVVFCLLQMMTMSNCFVRRLCAALALVALMLLLMSAEMTSSAPTGSGRTRHLAVYPSTYSYHVRRMGRCADDDRVFADCFICGRLADEVRIYRGCCNRRRVVLRYCEDLLS